MDLLGQFKPRWVLHRACQIREACLRIKAPLIHLRCNPLWHTCLCRVMGKHYYVQEEVLIISLKLFFLSHLPLLFLLIIQCFSTDLNCEKVMINLSIYSKFRYPTNGGSPTMQSPMGSPLGSSLMLDERTTPMMELSPPGLHEPNTVTISQLIPRNNDIPGR